MLATFAVAVQARAGEEFVSAPTEYFFCKNFDLSHTEHEADAQGNKLSATVFITGICAPRKEGYLPSGGWKHVTAEGRYDYATGSTSEKVITTSDGWVAVQVFTTCTSNPWAHTPACGAPSQLANNTGITLYGPFPISAHLLPPHLRTALAEWENYKTSEEMLTDWDPNPPQQEEELVIVQPPLSVPEEASFTVELNALHPEPSWMVELEWARIDKAKDPSIEIGGSWKYNTPANAPNLVPWSQFPKAIPIPGSFTPGQYALRAKVQGHPDNTKTNWKRFWVGPALADLGKALQAKVDIEGGKAMEYDLGQPGEGLLIGKGEARQFDFGEMPRFEGGQMKTLQAEMPPGTGPEPPAVPGGKPKGFEAKPDLKPLAPSLSVKTIAVSPVVGGWVESGKNISLSVEVANAGPAPAEGTEPIKLQCTVKSGGPCPVATGSHTVGKPIPVGESRSFTLISASAAEPGTYQVRAAPVGGARGTGIEVEIRVKGGRLSTDALRQKIRAPEEKVGPGTVTPGAREELSPKPEVTQPKRVLPGADAAPTLRPGVRTNGNAETR